MSSDHTIVTGPAVDLECVKFAPSSIKVSTIISQGPISVHILSNSLIRRLTNCRACQVARPLKQCMTCLILMGGAKI